MRNFLMAGLMAAVALPMGAAPALAQSHHGARHHDRDHQRRANRHERRAEVRHHRREVRRDRRHYRRERARDIRHDRRVVRHDRRAAQRRWSRYAWRDYRRSHRSIYHRGRWNAPFRYHRFRPGVRIRPAYFSSRYYIGDPGYFRLPPAGRFQRWVRHYDDVLLIDVRTGTVLRVYRDFFW